MSVVGSPLETAALQAVTAQHVASKARDKEKAESSSGRRFNDLVELRIAGVETADAVRALPRNDSEQAETEHDSDHPLPQPDQQTHIDVTG
jgi:hypothetical protein